MSETNDLLTAALVYAHRGWRVFPAKQDKSPYVKWKEKATTDEVQIREWWMRWPDANVAIMCGLNPDTNKALVVIDVDTRDNKCGDDHLRDWELTHSDLPETATVKTATGGFHYYFSGELAKTVGMGSGRAEFTGIDIRGNNSYVIAPPSETVMGAYPYTWEISYDEHPIEPIDDVTLTFIQQVLGKPVQTLDSKRSFTHFELPEQITEGSRNDTLYRYAASLQARSLPDEMIFNAVYDCNIARCDPNIGALSTDEVRKLVNSVLKNHNKGTSLLNTESVGYSHAIASRKIPEVIQGALYQSNVCLLSGPSKVGKTYLVSELAVAVASGTQWLKWQCTKGNVLVIDGEMELSELQRRYEDICDHLNLDRDETLARIHYFEEKGKADVLTNLENKYIAEAKRHNCNLIILDPAYPFMTGDENNAGDVRTFTNCVIKIAKETDAAVLYVHHHAKGLQGERVSIDRASGSGMFARTPDLIIDTIEIMPRDKDEPEPDYPAFQVDITARYFKPADIFNVWFKKPLHLLDETGETDGWKPMTSEQKGGNRSGAIATKRKEENKVEFVKQLNRQIAASGCGFVKLSDVIDEANENGIAESRPTIDRYLKELEETGEFFKRHEGKNAFVYKGSNDM